jgi:hypothetical protein
VHCTPPGEGELSAVHCVAWQAEYAYEAATDEELTIEEDQVLYVLEDDDAE